jgi:hypothetical protein
VILPYSEERDEARAEADHAKSDQARMARDVANMFDDLKALADRHAEPRADRARPPSWSRRGGRGGGPWVSSDRP